MRCGWSNTQTRSCPCNCKRRALWKLRLFGALPLGFSGKALHDVITREPGDRPERVALAGLRDWPGAKQTFVERQLVGPCVDARKACRFVTGVF